MAIAVSAITNLYSVDTQGARHYVEDELMLSDTRILFCDIYYAGGNVTYIDFNVIEGESIIKTIKMFPVEDISGGRTFGLSVNKIWEPNLLEQIDTETLTEAVELEGDIAYSITVPGDVNEKVGPVRINGDYSYYDYSPAPVNVTIFYRPQTSDQWCSANGEVELYCLLEMIPGDTITIEEDNAPEISNQ